MFSSIGIMCICVLCNVVTNNRQIYERHRRSGSKYICGVDEVGRGALAGPIVVAAVYIPPTVNIPNIKDSKKLKESVIVQTARHLKHHPEVHFAVREYSSTIVDLDNPLKTSLRGFNDCVKSLSKQVPIDCVLVDGPYAPAFETDVTHECIVKGDSKCVSIAAASIIAKAHRDHIMIEYHKHYPHYEFYKNKGYGTKKHRERIQRYGLTDIHRVTFCRKCVFLFSDKHLC